MANTHLILGSEFLYKKSAYLSCQNWSSPYTLLPLKVCSEPGKISPDSPTIPLTYFALTSLKSSPSRPPDIIGLKDIINLNSFSIFDRFRADTEFFQSPKLLPLEGIEMIFISYFTFMHMIENYIIKLLFFGK